MTLLIDSFLNGKVLRLACKAHTTHEGAEKAMLVLRQIIIKFGAIQ